MSKRIVVSVGKPVDALTRSQRGVGLLEIVIVLAVASILSAFAFIGITRARDSIRLQNSMRVFSGRVEKARLDAIRRHAGALIEFTSNRSYTITMDFGGTGDGSTQRTFNLEDNVVITNPDGTAIAAVDLPTIDFGWRGATPQCFTAIRMQNRTGEASTLAVTSSGDVTIDTNLGATVSPGSYANVNQTNDIATGATISGTNTASCDDPCGSCGVSSGGTVTSSPPSGCTAFTLNKSAITIRRNGSTTDSFTVNVTNTDTISVSQPDGRTNLQFSPSASQSVPVNGTRSFTIRSVNNSTGKFTIRFVSACNASNAVNVTVNVTK